MSTKDTKTPKSTCSKVKNPCKFCLQPVTNKNGLQCQGACKKWAHFKCLNYTPGKISDIKAGIIKVTCPCPDCESTQVKEFLVNPPFICSNYKCPANRIPKCESTECPTNKSQVQPTSPCQNVKCTNESIECPSAILLQSTQLKRKRSRSPSRSKKKSKSPPGSPAPKSKLSFFRRQSPKNCKPVCGDKKSKKKPKSTKKSSSCSLLSSDNLRCPGSKLSSSESNVSPKNQASFLQDLQEMCGTVGQLSIQLKSLMCKILQKV